MSITYSYQEPTLTTLADARMFRATSGGTVFTEVLRTDTTFDYFEDTAVVDDAFYFMVGININPAGIRLNVGTVFSATSYEIVWEYYTRDDEWVEIEDLQDNTNSLSVLGSNDVLFPLQWNPSVRANVGGVISTRNVWFRMRLKSVSGITEGGANTTDVVTYGDGRILITGSGTVTCQNIYDWVVANVTHINLPRSSNPWYYDFRKLYIRVTSPVIFETHQEFIETCNNMENGANRGFAFTGTFKTGTKVNDTTGINGSTFIIHASRNQSCFDTFSIGNEVYGATFRQNSQQFSPPGYINMNGEWIDNNMELSIRTPPAGSVVRNCRINSGLIIANILEGVFDKITYIIPGGYLFYVYRDGWDLEDFNYVYTGSTGVVFYIYQGSDQGSPKWRFINPVTPLNSLGEVPSPLVVAYGVLRDIESVKFYDASTDTYTDYTTEAQATAGEVPLSGEVGDCILMGHDLANQTAGACVYVEVPTQTNDYEYIYEANIGGTWQEIDKDLFVKDGTINFTETNYLYTCVPFTISAQTVDGVSALWVRARIITKGTGSPVATRIQKRNYSAVNNWKLEEVYTIETDIQDKDDNPLEGVNVKLLSNSTEIFSLDTDINGNIPRQEIVVKEFKLDPVNEPVFPHHYQQSIGNFKLVISKAGYETEEQPLILNEKKTLRFTLKKAIPLMITPDGNAHPKANRENIGHNREILL